MEHFRGDAHVFGVRFRIGSRVPIPAPAPDSGFFRTPIAVSVPESESVAGFGDGAGLDSQMISIARAPKRSALRLTDGADGKLEHRLAIGHRERAAVEGGDSTGDTERFVV